MGALFVPGLLVQPDCDLHSLLSTFCDDEKWSFYDLTKPYLVDGHAYASNGHIMARIVSDGDQSDSISKRRPDFSGVWTNYRSNPRMSELEMVPLQYDPSLAVAGLVRCPWCLSKRVPAPDAWVERCKRMYSNEEKFDTEFMRHAEDRGLYWYDCWDNDEPCTVFDSSCVHCHGLASEMMGDYPIGNAHIDVLYASKIAQIPGVKISLPNEIAKSREEIKPLFFSSEIGIEGFVMPLFRGDYSRGGRS